jgi:putative component of toxin-antitoxin plasmid stabilization module
VNTFYRTAEFDAWLSGLRDYIGKARILKRIRQAGSRFENGVTHEKN